LRLHHPPHALVDVLLHQLDLGGIGFRHALDLARVQLLRSHLLLLRLQQLLLQLADLCLQGRLAPVRGTQQHQQRQCEHLVQPHMYIGLA
jgi:hypothetical protein